MRYGLGSQIVVALFLIVMCSGACVGRHSRGSDLPLLDPINSVPASLLRKQGLAFATTGDLIRARAYLVAARLKGYDDRVIVPELVRVCVSASLFQSALFYSEQLIRKYPNDADMIYVVGTICLALGYENRARFYLEKMLGLNFVTKKNNFSSEVISGRVGRREDKRRYLDRYFGENLNGKQSKIDRYMLLKDYESRKKRHDVTK